MVLKGSFFQESEAPMCRIFRLMKTKTIALVIGRLWGFRTASMHSPHWLISSFRKDRNISVIVFKLAVSRTSEHKLWVLKMLTQETVQEKKALTWPSLLCWPLRQPAFPSLGMCVYRRWGWRLARNTVKSGVEEWWTDSCFFGFHG